MDKGDIGEKMKHSGKIILGDELKINKLTKGWSQVNIHPTIFYRRQNEIYKIINSSKNYCAELDTGDTVIVRFLDRNDMDNFISKTKDYL
jgi:hypothetical protein